MPGEDLRDVSVFLQAAMWVLWVCIGFVAVVVLRRVLGFRRRRP
jgi:hypothetical protein